MWSRSARPIRTSFYLEGSYLWLLSDRSETLVDTDDVFVYTLRRERTSIRGGAGLRFSWLGFLGVD